MRTISLAVATVWTLLVLLQEPGYFVRSGVDLGPEAALWSGLLVGTWAGALAMPGIWRRLGPAIRRSRQPLAAAFGVQIAWACTYVLIGFLTVGVQGLWDAVADRERADGLLGRAFTQWGLLICWASLIPGLSVWARRPTVAIACWALFWLGGLGLGLPFPLQSILAIGPSWNVLLIWASTCSASVAILLHQFDALSDSR